MSDGPLRPVCALGTSPTGGGKGRGTEEVRSWLPLWGSWHGAAVTERALPRNFHENVFFPFTAGQNYDIVAQHDNCVFMPTLLVAGHGPGNSPGLHPPATRKIGQTNMKGGNSHDP